MALGLRSTIFVMALLFGTQAMAYEEPTYEIVFVTDGYEVRRYQGRLAAQVSGSSATNSAFRKLFKYISGANTASEKVAMTVPVAQSVSIEMTVPVMTPSKPYMQFFLPSSFTLETAPVPTDPGIKIVSVEGGYYAVLEYSGRSTNANFDKQQRILVNSLERDGVTQKSAPIMATYNGPLTLPFMRRNAVMVMIEWKSE
jgi:DNA gyrase inhibitor GyrI